MRACIKLLSMFLVLSLQGCNLWDYLKPPTREPAPPQGSRIEAQELLYSYLNSRLAGENTENLRAYLTEEAWNDYRSSKLSLQSNNNKEIVGYKILEQADLSNGRFAFTVSLQTADRTEPLAENTIEDLIVTFNNDEYRVSSARLLESTTIKGEAGELIWIKNPVEGKQKKADIFNLQELPAQMVPIGGTNGQEFGVGKEGYSTVILNPESQGLAFGTRGTHCAVALLNWEGKTALPEKVKLTPIDLLYGGRAKLLAFSPDSQYLMVESTTPAGTDRVFVYQTDARNKLNFNLDQDFPIEVYNINFSRWEVNSQSILIRVTSGPDQTRVDQGKLGTWVIKIESGKREKVIGE